MKRELSLAGQPQPIHVFLVDDHPVVRRGLAAVLEAEPDIRVAGEAADVEHAAAQLETARPDVLLVDIDLRGGNGLDLLRHVRAQWIGLKMIVVSQHAPELFADRAQDAGASGYVCKQDAPEHIVEAVRSVYDGFLYFRR